MHNINLPERVCLGHNLRRDGGIGACLPVRCIIAAFAGCVEARVGGAGGAGYAEFVGACGWGAADAEAGDGPAICCCVCGSFGTNRAGCGEGGHGHGHEEGG